MGSVRMVHHQQDPIAIPHFLKSQEEGRSRAGLTHQSLLSVLILYSPVPSYHTETVSKETELSYLSHPRGRLMAKQFQYEALPPQIQILDQFARVRMEIILNYDSCFLHPFIKE